MRRLAYLLLGIVIGLMILGFLYLGYGFFGRISHHVYTSHGIITLRYSKGKI